jgi:hypothetical protein
MPEYVHRFLCRHSTDFLTIRPYAGGVLFGSQATSKYVYELEGQ